MTGQELRRIAQFVDALQDVMNATQISINKLSGMKLQIADVNTDATYRYEVEAISDMLFVTRYSPHDERTHGA